MSIPGLLIMHVFYRKDGGCGRDAKKPGEAGRYIQDDPRKYPDKENLGPFGQCSHLLVSHQMPWPCAQHKCPEQCAAVFWLCMC